MTHLSGIAVSTKANPNTANSIDTAAYPSITEFSAMIAATPDFIGIEINWIKMPLLTIEVIRGTSSLASCSKIRDGNQCIKTVAMTIATAMPTTHNMNFVPCVHHPLP